jgi:hypothetical protein
MKGKNMKDNNYDNLPVEKLIELSDELYLRACLATTSIRELPKWADNEEMATILYHFTTALYWSTDAKTTEIYGKVILLPDTSKILLGEVLTKWGVGNNINYSSSYYFAKDCGLNMPEPTSPQTAFSTSVYAEDRGLDITEILTWVANNKHQSLWEKECADLSITIITRLIDGTIRTLYV